MLNTTEDLSTYTRRVSRLFRKLSAKEERSLGRRVRKGDVEAINTLVEANLPLVMFYAKKFSTPGMALSDLIQEGNIGLVTAAKTFNYRRGCRFSTHAVWYIRGHIHRSVENKSRLVKLPTNFYYLNRKNREAIEKGKSCVRIPSRIKRGYSPFDYDFKFIELESIYNLHTQDSEFISLMEDRDELEELMVDLTDLEKKIIYLYYGLHNIPQLNIIESSTFLGVSKSTVGNILNRALRKMRREAYETIQKQATPKLSCLSRQIHLHKN
jgi:RNA polymerase primary sigma factor